jgi:hypothetical protein
MVHRIYPILIGLAFSLVFLALPAAAAQSSGAAEYSGAGAGGLVARAAPDRSSWGQDRLLLAQLVTPAAREDDASEESRAQLRRELDRIRRPNAREAAPRPRFAPPVPERRKPGQTVVTRKREPASRRLPTGQADPKVDRLMGRLLLFNFRGAHPSDNGARAVHALIRSGHIAGVVLSRENIRDRSQLKGLIKFLASAGRKSQPIIGIREIGGASEAFPAVRSFELWPSQRDVAARGNPQYAYSTYRSMGAALASFGFNMNFGPVLAATGNAKDPGASFGNNPLQTGVFAKTFLLGHKEENIVAVPMVDPSAHSVKALKTILVSDPGLPVSAVMKEGSGIAPFAAYAGLVRGARFCFAALPAAEAGAGAVSGFRRGCDMLILDGGSDSPDSVREQAALGITKAIQVNELSFDALTAAAERAAGFHWPDQTSRAASAGGTR